ncbi:hypothetical protein ABK040_012003 [Willaertia magna]
MSGSLKAGLLGDVDGGNSGNNNGNEIISGSMDETIILNEEGRSNSSVNYYLQSEEETSLKQEMKKKRKSLLISANIKLLVLFIILSIPIIISVVALILFLTYKSNNNDNTSKIKEMVLLISIDGFRHDYFYKFKSFIPNILKIRNSGTFIEKLKPVFPTKTFPNHYSIATGQFVESHGITSNKFYDPKLKAVFSQMSKESAWWEQGEPIWITSEKQNVRTAAFDYPGSNVKIQGLYPTFYEENYSNDDILQKRLDKLQNYLDLNVKNDTLAPKLMMFYLPWLDDQAHYHGIPENEEEAKQTEDGQYFIKGLKSVDNAVGEMYSMVERFNLTEKVNFIVLSDHGMANVSKNRTIYLKDILARYYQMNTTSSPIVISDVVKSYTYGTLVDLYVLPESADERLRFNTIQKLYEDLQNAKQMFSLNCSFYLKSEMPDRLHYKNNSRIPDILVVSDVEWYSGIDDSSWWGEKGDHGYDNTSPLMQAMFIAKGPQFKEGGIKAYEAAENINIHALLAKLLSINPSPKTQGNSENLKDLLK